MNHIYHAPQKPQPPTEGWESFEKSVRRKLDNLRVRGRDRYLRQTQMGEQGIDLTHNDYLGLRSDAIFQAQCRQAIETLPVGSGASRLLGGEHEIYSLAENAFSQFKKAESSLLFTSGYAANEALISALAHLPNVRFFVDRLCHASTVDGIKLAGSSREKFSFFHHQDLTDLEIHLKDSNADINFIVTEAVFSMDGDIAPVSEIQSLCRKYRGCLILDEAHSLGVFGDHGQGLAGTSETSHDHIITINPCGKAFGCQGAFVCGPRWLNQWLINRARSFIFSTGISPWVAASLNQAIQYIPTLKNRRQKLLGLGQTLRQDLLNLDYNIGLSESHIIPIIVGSESKSIQLSHWLQDHGVLIKAIRPPTVPTNDCRLRLSLHSELEQRHMETLSHLLKAARLA